MKSFNKSKAIRIVLVLLMMALGAVGSIGLCISDKEEAHFVIMRSAALRGEFPKPANHSRGKVHYDLLAKLLANERASAASIRDPAALSRAQTQPHPLLGRPAPRIVLSDYQGNSWRLSDCIAGGPVVVVFYLGYYCNACVQNLIELNVELKRFHELGAEIVAISGDAPELTRKRFEEYGRFDFPTLFDPDHAIAQMFGVYQPAQTAAGEQLLHGTFVVDRGGIVCWAYCGESPFGEIDALVRELADPSNVPTIPDSKSRRTESDIR